MSLRIDQNIQLAIKFLNNPVYNDLVPCRSHEFFLNGEKVEIDALHKGNVGYHHRNNRYSFTLVIYQMGHEMPKHVTKMFLENTEFTILQYKYAGGTWLYGDLQWNNAIFTGVRGTGTAPDDIPILTVTAKALEMVLDGVTYGHTL